MIRNPFRSRSVVISWLFSYILLLAIPIAITIISYIRAEDIVENELNHANRIMLEHSQLLMDTGLEDVNRFIYQIGINPKIRNLADAARTITVKDYSQVLKVRDDLLANRAVTGFVKEYYIYLPKSDRILTPSGMIDKIIFYQSNWETTAYKNDITYEEWARIIQGTYAGKYISIRSPEAEGQQTDILYTQGIPIVSSNPYAFVTVLLDSNRFYDSIRYMHELTKGWGLFLDSENQVLFSNLPFSYDISSEFNQYTEPTGSIEHVIGDKEYKISYIKSEKTDWKYVSVIPMEIYGQKVKDIRKISYIAILLCLFLGGIITALLTKRNYRSIRTLLERIQKKSSAVPANGMNEFKLIENIIQDTVEESRRIQLSQNKVLRSNFLAGLLKGKLQDREYIQKAMQSYQVSFQSDSFAVVLIYVKDYSKLFENDKSSPESQEKLVQLIISNIAEELAMQNNLGYVTEVDDTLACIINFIQSDSVEQEKDIMRIAEQAEYYLKNMFYIDCVISASSVHNSVIGLHAAYQEALDVMEYKIVTENNDIVAYMDTTVTSSAYNYPVKTEQFLINCIKAGDLDSAKRTIYEIFETNVLRMPPSIDLLRCFMFDLASTMLKTLPEISILTEGSFFQELDMVNRLMSVRNISDFRKEILAILTEICNYVQKNKKDKNAELIDKVTKYIQSNYFDMNMNVTTVADHFNLSACYLTKLFKEKTGEVLSNYITKVRIEESKKLLQSTDLTISDISCKTGYYNSNIYIRAFKKYEGITPGTYRKVSRQGSY
ncbi:MAG TPA: helix-turn-helix transcriptional regulator [Clostridiales bacterium]|nr:helix-turn-helix transcriptional regulator [Clostridiales bacterium]